jgi:hypothetical protein
LTEDGLFSFSPPPIVDSGKLFSPNGLLPVSPVAPTPLSSFPPVPLSVTSVPPPNKKASDEQYHALVDSGSSDCFIDEKFVTKNNLSTYLVTPLALRLFDSTTNSVITEAVDTRLRFASGNITQTTFYITSLDGTCSMVLGHNWLTRHNPLIDWVKSSISFRTSEHSSPASVHTPLSHPEPIPPVDSTTPITPIASDCQAPSIEFVSRSAFPKLCKLEGSNSYSLSTLPLEAKLHAASSSSETIDLSAIPEQYHEFSDVFSKSKASILAPHCEYDLKIDLEEGTSPPLGTLYSLSLP